MTNTEKPTTIAEKKRAGVAKAPKEKIQKITKTKVSDEKVVKTEKIVEDTQPQTDEQTKAEEKQKEETKETPKEDKKKLPQKKAVKKDEVAVNAKGLHISTKYAIELCKFVKGKKIDRAIEDLELVIVKKKSVPMKGEIPHRKGPGGRGSGSGRYPKKASESFIMLLKSLRANANNHEVDDPVITEAVANIAQRPFARGGRRRKRTHVTIKARERRSAYPKLLSKGAKKIVKKTKNKIEGRLRQ
ncbi:MAG: uL22 family ribosomal protein [Nanoarchaeota archaeon]